eukprot:GHVU01166766.1.p1 GENE.GHVU01166766.1~~GHVU01166766.1.p1  ORF type:complete len:194 (-),score=34.70 GHVU01166766.1:550-1131(-)
MAAATIAAAAIPELIKAAKEGLDIMDVIGDYYDKTIAIYKKFEGATEFKDRNRSLELLLVNATHHTLVFEEEYFDSGTWFWSPLPLNIKPGKSSIMYVADRQGSILCGVTGGLRYKIEGDNKYLYLGFTNPEAGCYKNFITVTPNKMGAKFGYDNAEDDTVKHLDVAGYHVQCTMKPPKKSDYKMFEYVIYKK